MDTWTLNKDIINKIKTAQKGIERMMLCKSPRVRFTNKGIHRRSTVTNVAVRICSLKRILARHVARQRNGRWIRTAIEYRSWNVKRSRGRPQARSLNDIKGLADTDWINKAQNREKWSYFIVYSN